MAVKAEEHEQKSGSDTRLLVSVPEAAELLSIGVTFAWELVHEGTIPSIKLGRRVLIPRHRLERLIRQQQFEAIGDE
jgi:excisionase family DNA binding protein